MAFERQRELFAHSNELPSPNSNSGEPPSSKGGTKMSVPVISIGLTEANELLQVSEGQFADAKAIEIAPAKLTHSLSAFSNSDGGDLYIGIAGVGPEKTFEWRGFANQEAANGHIQAFEALFPLGQDFRYEFLRCQELQGLVLHAEIRKTLGVTKASNNIPYIRRGAQNLPVNTADALKRLEFSKGIATFESELANAPETLVSESETIKNFIQRVVPRSTPEAWIAKQLLVRDHKPTVAGLLLFADEPQAALPKRCGIKIYRYKTKAAEGFRDALAFDPITIEGPLFEQIASAVETTIAKIQEIPKMGDASLEQIRYPQEALHEIITNAVLHRDYSITDDVHIRIFDNRIEVQSPGRLPAHITVENILHERFARNPLTVRLLNKFPNPPNKDVGEGLNTAFSAMHELGLRSPKIVESENAVLVIIGHEKLASAEEAIMDYLEEHEWIGKSCCAHCVNYGAKKPFY